MDDEKIIPRLPFGFVILELLAFCSWNPGAEGFWGGSHTRTRTPAERRERLDIPWPEAMWLWSKNLTYSKYCFEPNSTSLSLLVWKWKDNASCFASLFRRSPAGE